jgi:RNA polymerase sigma-70 factor (ECF subfamily)
MEQRERHCCAWATLMRAANAGDDRAYRRVLEGIAPILRAQIRSALRRTISNVEDAEDILQETLLAIHLKRHSWRHDKPFTPWMRAIADHKLIDEVRRRGRYITLPLDDFEATLAAPEEEWPLSSMQARAMLTAIGGRSREVVEAIAFDGMTIQETALRLGMRESAVRVARHRGIKALATAVRRRNRPS